jgi:excisionase family DNA binding protein
MRYLTTAQVADRFGVNVRTVSRWVLRGRLRPATRAPGLRGAYLFHPDTIDKAQQRQEAGT